MGTYLWDILQEIIKLNALHNEIRIFALGYYVFCIVIPILVFFCITKSADRVESRCSGCRKDAGAIPDRHLLSVVGWR